jgi:hypothetical protein
MNNSTKRKRTVQPKLDFKAQKYVSASSQGKNDAETIHSQLHKTKTKDMPIVIDIGVSNKSNLRSEIKPEKNQASGKHSDAQENVERADANGYVQSFLHREVHYHTKGHASLKKGEVDVFRFIEEHFTIPTDIETTDFGVLSGHCFEERLISAFLDNRLQPKLGHEAFWDTQICVTCGKLGHTRNHCPDGF